MTGTDGNRNGDAVAPGVSPTDRVVTSDGALGRLVRRLRTRLGRVRLADGTMLALAGITGITTGAAAAALILAVRTVEELAFGEAVTTAELLLVPAAGALLVALIARYAPEVLGSGIVTTMETLVLRTGRFRRRTPLATILASSIAIGTGAAGGREAPMVLTGGSIGSIVGRVFGVDDEQVRSLVAAGAAAAIGASFNAPIGGMLFAIEVIVGGLRSRSLQVIVVSSVAGSVVARQLVGEGLIYRPRIAYTLNDPRELVLHLLVGLAAATVAVLLLRLEPLALRSTAGLRRRFGVVAPLVAGMLAVGAIAALVPEVLGSGENLPPINGVREPVQQLIDGGYGVGWTAVTTIAVLLVAKFGATMATVASRTAVGQFAPTLFLGAAVGALVGTIAATLVPDVGIQPGAYALVGMAATYGAAARAPLTSVLIVFELSGDYGLVLPLMLAVGVATFLSDRASDHSVYTGPLADRGIVYAEPDDVDLLQTVQVHEVQTSTHPTVHPDLPLPELRRRFAAGRTHGMAVVADDRLVGVVTLTDLARAEGLLADGIRPPESIRVSDLMTSDVVTTRPDDEVFRALRRMSSIDAGRIPVVTSAGRYTGMLRRGDVVAAYSMALARSQRRQADEDRARLRDLTGLRFVELRVASGSSVAGRPVAEVTWPPSTVLTSIRRGGEVLVPKGDTVLRIDDEVVALAPTSVLDEMRALLAAVDVDEI
jgi:CIC family chloride channel protein